jgi:hypothetical protein
MTADDTLWDLEERFWTQGADSARHATAKGAVFVLPYPAGILQGDALWREKDVAQRWRSVEMSERYLSRQNDIAVWPIASRPNAATSRSIRRSAPRPT